MVKFLKRLVFQFYGLFLTSPSQDYLVLHLHQRPLELLELLLKGYLLLLRALNNLILLPQCLPLALDFLIEKLLLSLGFDRVSV